jgi:hypothetical protein
MDGAPVRSFIRCFAVLGFVTTQRFELATVTGDLTGSS